MVVNHQLQKVRCKADRKFHDRIVRELFESPGFLGIDGLNSDTVIWKACEYHYMHGTRHRTESKYEVFPASDVVFFYVANGFNFLVLEVKGSILGRSHVEAERQLDRGESYFKGFWKAILVNQAKPTLLSKFREFPYTEVFLSLAEVVREPLMPEYTTIPYRTGLCLGKVRGSYSEYRVWFTE